MESKRIRSLVFARRRINYHLQEVYKVNTQDKLVYTFTTDDWVTLVRDSLDRIVATVCEFDWQPQGGEHEFDVHFMSGTYRIYNQTFGTLAEAKDHINRKLVGRDN